jgi:hypothetical protein
MRSGDTVPVALILAVLTACGGPDQYVSAWLRYAALIDDRVFRMCVAILSWSLWGEHGQTFDGDERASSPRVRTTFSGHSSIA